MLSIAQVDKIIYGLSTILTRTINRKKDLRQMQFSRILIIRLDEIGDLCYSGPVFEALRHRYPSAEITLWCQPFAKALMHDHPSLNYIITAQSALGKNYDLIVDLRGKWAGLFFAMKHPPEARLDRGTIRLMHKRQGQHPHAMITNFEIIRPLIDADAEMPVPKLYPSATDRQSALDFIRANQLNRFAIIHPGARRELRRWSPQRFSELATILKKEYLLDIVFTGDPSEKEMIDGIRHTIPFTTYSTAGNLSLGAVAAFMQHASLFVGNESGPLHMAALSSAPSIGLYGPGEPHVFYPVTPRTAVVHHVLECNPCDQIHCKYPEFPCIQRITIPEVLQKVKEIIS